MMPDAIPGAIYDQMLANHKLVGSPGLAWKRHIVTVAFNGGSDALYALIEQTASEWTSQGGEMQFSFRDAAGHFRRWTSQDTSPAAAIRVAFYSDKDRGGYWSAVGVMAQNINANEPTLNLDGFPKKLAPYLNGQNAPTWRTSYEHTVILHEFGHALGLSHEHFNPKCQADLKLDMAIASLMQPPNSWSEVMARFNMDASYYFQEVANQAKPLDTRPVTSPTTDQSSVMLYSFNDNFFNSGADSPCKPAGPLGYATTLSSGDRQFFLDNYRKIPSPF